MTAGWDPGWRLFGPWHLGILAAIAVSAWALRGALLRWPKAAGRTVAVTLAVGELIWYAYRFKVEGFQFPEGVPLQLCDLTVWLTAFTVIARRQAVFEFTFFAGSAGAGMALLFPDLWAPLCSYPSVYFFFSHGLVVASLAGLAWAGQMRPMPGCVWRSMAVLNVYAGIVALFNLAFKTNYMYLCKKPAGASPLVYLGPWPWYIVSGEIVAMGLFALLWLPFWARGRWRRPDNPA